MQSGRRHAGGKLQSTAYGMVLSPSHLLYFYCVYRGALIFPLPIIPSHAQGLSERQQIFLIIIILEEHVDSFFPSPTINSPNLCPLLEMHLLNVILYSKLEGLCPFYKGM